MQYERQREKHADEEIRHALDDDLAGIRSLLGAPNRREDPKRDQFMRAPLPVSSTWTATADDNQKETEEEQEEDEAVAPVASTSKSILTFVKPVNDPSSVDKSLLVSLLGEEDTPATDEPQRPQPQIHPSRAGNHDEVLAGLARFDRNNAFGDDDDADADDADPYDRFVRELAFEKRAAPSDRLKSEAEAAIEAAEALKRSEAARLKRMRGEESEAEESDARSRKINKKLESARLPEGDDLDDEYGIEGDEVGGFALGLGEGLEGSDKEASEDEASENESDAGSEDDEEDDESSDSDESAGDIAETELLADLLHRDAEVKHLDDETERTQTKGKTSRASTSSASQKGNSTLPYTFPCPESHEHFLDLISGHEQELPTIVERIRTLYHPSLGEGNKEKLAVRNIVQASVRSTCVSLTILLIT